MKIEDKKIINFFTRRNRDALPGNVLPFLSKSPTTRNILCRCVCDFNVITKMKMMGPKKESIRLRKGQRERGGVMF